MTQIKEWLIQFEEYAVQAEWLRSAKSLAIALALLLAALILRRGIASLMMRLISRVRREHEALRDEWRKRLSGPLASVILALAVMAGTQLVFTDGTVSTFLNQITRSLFYIALFHFLYCVVGLVRVDLEFVIEKRGRKVDLTALSYISTTIKVLIVALGALAVLSNWVDNVSALVASIGIGGLIVALAAQDTASNIFASIAVLLDKPFSVGDWVNIEGAEGSVEKIGLRSTHIRRADRSLVALPNSTVANSMISNMTQRTLRLVNFSIEPDKATSSKDIVLLLEDIRTILSETDGVEEEGQIVRFDRLENNGLAILIRFLTENNYARMLEVREQVNIRILQRLELRQIRLASTAVTVYNKGGTSNETTDLGS